MDEEFRTSLDEVFQGWAQKVNEVGVIYYVKDEQQLTSWIHPYVDKVLKDCGTLFSDVKYAAYRTALKLRVLQVQLGLQWISVVRIRETFPQVGDETDIQPMTYKQALELIEKTLQLSQHEDMNVERLSQAADLILNLLANLYDTSHSGKIVPRCVLTFLTALCGSNLGEKYKFLCSRLPRQDGKISREQLLYLIDDLMQIPYILKESLAFGIDVAAAVDSCLTNCNESVGVSPDGLYSWLCREPQTIVWLPTLHRIAATEKVQHAVSCKVCRIQPITGFRYKCLFCIGYNLCQNCFLRACVSLSHKLGHPVREYCFPVTSTDCTRAWLHIMKNKLLRRQRATASVTPYLAVEGSGYQGASLDWEPRSIQVDQSNSMYHCSDSGPGSCTSADQSNEPVQTDCKKEVQTNPLARLGQPFDSSSPVAANSVRDSFSKLDMETQHKMMVLQIEELKQENRALRKKLNEYHQSQEGLSEPVEEQHSKVAIGSTISPINNCSKIGAGVCAEYGTCERQEQDTLAIVGAITPVRTMDLPASVVKPYTRGSAGETVVECDITESTRADGLQYRSGDMSLLSEDNTHEQWDSKVSINAEFSTSCGNLTKADEAYKPSDMSLLCAGLAKAKLEHVAVDRDHIDKNQDIISSMIEKEVSEENSVSVLHSLENKHKSYTTFDAEVQNTPDLSHPSHLIGNSQVLLPQEFQSCNEIDLSKIHPGSSITTPELMLQHPREKFCLPSTPEYSTLRRMTLEPQHQSTPVTTAVFTKRANSIEHLSHGCRRRSSSHRKENTEDSVDTEDKENISPKQQSPSKHVTSFSVEDDYSEKSRVFRSTQFLSKHTMRHKDPQCPQPSENLRDSKTMLTQDKDELDQIMAEFERECKISDHTQSDGATRVLTINDSSVMEAAFNIGDALAEFVQAVAKSDGEENVSLTSEMTHF